MNNIGICCKTLDEAKDHQINQQPESRSITNCILDSTSQMSPIQVCWALKEDFQSKGIFWAPEEDFVCPESSNTRQRQSEC